ncbi:MAG TPA: bacillithiol biosynthesis cysteine-adding enzyme BshC [Thermoanaerobaculia bacterium]|nr:bacillithiol biosynthesis cysteine-adding enzyme BshC [Thermoanaerobaculia bacterium]
MAPARAADRLSVDLASAGLLPPLPRAYLDGRDLDLLAPLRFLEPGRLPEPADGASAPDRSRLAESLRAANRAYGHPGADRLARLLADPETRVVVAGQQPGLFGGPLYTLSKMVAAARWAEELERSGRGSSGIGGRPAVAVFWVATEDHDWAEVSRATFLAPEGARRFDLGPDPDPLLPVGMRTLGPEVAAILAALPELRASERSDRWVETLARIYRPDARFGEAFSRWAVAILGERCPLLLDAMDPAVKEAEAPWLARLVERRAAWREAAAEADRRIEERGYPLQVHPQPEASPLFELRGGERRRIEWSRLNGEGEGYRLRGSEAPPRPVAELLERIADNPGTVSPGVLARPAVQDAILGTTLQVLGPGELSYMAQAAPAYRVLGVAAPWVALRPQTLVLEARDREQLEELALPLAALLGPDEALERALAGADGAGFVTRARSEVDAVLAGIREEALALDPDLERPFEKTRENLLRALETFAGKVTAAAARRDQVRSARVDRLRGVCRPEGALQERVVSSSHFPGKHGERFAEALWEQLELDGRRLQVIEP